MKCDSSWFMMYLTCKSNFQPIMGVDESIFTSQKSPKNVKKRHFVFFEMSLKKKFQAFDKLNSWYFCCAAFLFDLAKLSLAFAYSARLIFEFCFES